MIYTLTLNPAVDLELTSQQLQMNEVNRAISSRKDCGGKGLNVSRMLKIWELTVSQWDSSAVKVASGLQNKCNAKV